MVVYKLLTSIVIIGSFFLFENPCYAMEDFLNQKNNIDRTLTPPLLKQSSNTDTWSSSQNKPNKSPKVEQSLKARFNTARNFFTQKQEKKDKPDKLPKLERTKSFSPAHPSFQNQERRSVTNNELNEVALLKRTSSAREIFSSLQKKEETILQPPKNLSLQKEVNQKKSFFHTILSTFGSPKKSTKQPPKNPSPLNQMNKKETSELKKPTFMILPTKDWDDPEWPSSDEEKSTRFSVNTLKRANNIKKLHDTGLSTLELLAQQGKGWFAENHALYIQSVVLRSENKKGISEEFKKKAKEIPHLGRDLLLQAHEDGFPSATYELLQEAIRDKNVDEAKLRLDEVCKNLIKHSKELDPENIDQLVKGISTIVEKNPDLQDNFNMFKTHSLFQKTATEQPKMNHKLPNTTAESKNPVPSFEKYAEPEKSLQEICQELFDNEISFDKKPLFNNAQLFDDELFFEDE